jgi:hypothetical protein
MGKEGPEQLSPGDQLAFSEDLFDSSKRKLGVLDAGCVVTRPGTFETASAQCTATATLPGGALVLAVGGKPLTEKTDGAIIGGTGKYASARGTFTDEHFEGKPAVDTFKVTIPKK